MARSKAHRDITCGHSTEQSVPRSAAHCRGWFGHLLRMAVLLAAVGIVFCLQCQTAAGARSCVPVAMEWLLELPGTGCVSKAWEQQCKLAAMVAELTPALPDRREGQGQ